MTEIESPEDWNERAAEFANQTTLLINRGGKIAPPLALARAKILAAAFSVGCIKHPSRHPEWTAAMAAQLRFAACLLESSL